MKNLEIVTIGLVINLLDDNKKDSAKAELTEILKAVKVLRKYEQISFDYDLYHNCFIHCFGIHGNSYDDISIKHDKFEIVINVPNKTVTIYDKTNYNKKIKVYCSNNKLSEHLSDLIYGDVSNVVVDELDEVFNIID